MVETCNVKRGSLACEECDNWVIVERLPESQKYPHGFAVQRCKLDEVSGGSATNLGTTIEEQRLNAPSPLRGIGSRESREPAQNPITSHQCFGCDYAVYSEEGFIDACDMPSTGCPRGFKITKARAPES